MEALEDALLARAVHYRMSDAAYARARAGIASPQAFLESLAGRTFRRQGPTWWCEACPTPCRYGYEGNAIGTETDFRTDIERVFLEAPADRPAAISEALDLSRDTHMHDLPTFASGMRYCAVAHALDTLPLTRRTVTRTLTSIR